MVGVEAIIVAIDTIRGNWRPLGIVIFAVFSLE